MLAAEALLPSEKSGPVVKGAKTFGLAEPHVATITDEGPGLMLAVEEMEQDPLLCIEHYSKPAFKAARAITPAEEGNQFYRDFNRCIYSIVDEKELKLHFEYMQTRYSAYSDATRFIKKLINDAAKTCIAYTSKYFTAGHTTTQRAESMNSKLKGKT